MKPVVQLVAPLVPITLVSACGGESSGERSEPKGYDYTSTYDAYSGDHLRSHDEMFIPLGSYYVAEP